MGVAESAEPHPKKPVRAKVRRAVWWGTPLLVFVIVYLGVNILYGRSTQMPDAPEISSPEYATIYVRPYGIIPLEDQLKVKVFVDVPDKYWADGKTTTDMQLHLLSEDRTVSAAKGSTTFSADTTVFMSDGSFERYPLDRYREYLAAYVSASTDAGTVAIPTQIVVWGKFPGWRVFAATSQDPEEAAFRQSLDETDPSAWDETVATVPLVVARNGSTMTFVALILIAMVALSALALVVSRSVALRRRRVEATLAGWFAALLFAMVPLRTNLPGAPPIGVWIDFLVFLWTLIALMLSLGIFIVSWLRYTPRPDALSSQGKAAPGSTEAPGSAVAPPPKGPGTSEPEASGVPEKPQPE